ncbi:MAG: ABC transporter permease [Nocardioides sp.]|uniref:ABC transporter permease n=1 Tax=Nocardioides sp. TaxID=35761 RepID=UPI0039E5F05B
MSETTQAPVRQVREVHGELVEPGATQGLMEVFRRRYLLKLLVERELAARYEGSALGFVWSYINPLSQFFIYWFVMGKIMGAHGDIQNYPLHIFSALIATHFFTETFAAGTRSIVRNKSLMNRMAMPREMFPVAAMVVSLVHVGPQLVILLVACFASGWHPELAGVVALVLALLLAMILGTALALLFSVANVFWRDFGSFVNILTNYIRWGVPMVYSWAMVAHSLPRWLEEVYLADPVAIAVLLMQRAFWVGSVHGDAVEIAMPDHLFLRALVAVLVSVVALVIAQRVFSKFDRKLVDSL